MTLPLSGHLGGYMVSRVSAWTYIPMAQLHARPILLIIQKHFLRVQVKLEDSSGVEKREYLYELCMLVMSCTMWYFYDA